VRSSTGAAQKAQQPPQKAALRPIPVIALAAQQGHHDKLKRMRAHAAAAAAAAKQPADVRFPPASTPRDAASFGRAAASPAGGAKTHVAGNICKEQRTPKRTRSHTPPPASRVPAATGKGASAGGSPAPKAAKRSAQRTSAQTPPLQSSPGVRTRRGSGTRWMHSSGSTEADPAPADAAEQSAHNPARASSCRVKQELATVEKAACSGCNLTL
jgi:hypothetical protein